MNSKLSSSLSSSQLIYKKTTKTPRSLSNVTLTPKKILKQIFPTRRNLSLAADNENANLEASARIHSRRSPRAAQSPANQSNSSTPNNSTSISHAKLHKFSPRTILTAKNSTKTPRSSSLFSPHQSSLLTPQNSHIKSPKFTLEESLKAYNLKKHAKNASKKSHSTINLSSSAREVPQESFKENPNSPPNLAELITQVKPSESKEKGSSKLMKMKADAIYREHLFQTCQALKFIKRLQPASFLQLNEKKINLPRKEGTEGKKTLVFDLDETLVHCNEVNKKYKPDVILPIHFVTGEVINAGISVRPYTKECLEYASQNFEVIVFTASHQCYADRVLDYLDPNNELIHHRLYRESCIVTQGVYIKDLRIFLNRDLNDLIIVDNAVYSFAYQLDNGIPIISWFDDKNDTELFNLIDYLKILQTVPDIREVNRKTFKLYSLAEESDEKVAHQVKRRVAHRKARSVDVTKNNE
ncbi:unnamed protein product [Blepharisma stoltei]|uniref:FCP1 homology domain-containing protein n=1 Tax=Blepharisma stoltei TaxID=1481888 RepID=A0AAU9J8X1_9CILI|nr:unnamed protein product [Blepharisma stoltei]